VMQLLRALLARAPGELLAAEPKVDLVTLQRELDEQLKGVELIQRHAFSDVQTRLSEANHAAETEALWLYGTLAGTTGLAAYLVYSFFLVMRGGLAKLNLQMSRMAQGDLSARPQGLGGDEVADTLAAMNVSLARLSDLLAAVRQGVGAITHASKQIASGNAELSERSKRSAEGLDQLMAGVTRYTDQLQDCSRSIESVVTTVQALRLASMRNRRHVVQLQERMGALRESSRAIGEIVTMIDTIAFRTNILALNAQVEASKAGDAGRGFAVVAQEVRALATRSAESARRVSDIVAGSGLQIEQAAALADETGGAIQVADGQVDAIHLAMSNVARLTQQGDSESAAILDEISQLKNGTDKNLDLVHQLATAADALRTQGERLSYKVGAFKLS
jgi:methyl-accepting chemotaxis protein-1 (serine sensor receptor)